MTLRAETGAPVRPNRKTRRQLARRARRKAFREADKAALAAFENRRSARIRILALAFLGALALVLGLLVGLAP